MKTNGLRIIIYRGILLAVLSLYFLLVFGQTEKDSSLRFTRADETLTSAPAKLLNFEGVSSENQVRLAWEFDNMRDLDQCVLERADEQGGFKPVAYFFITEDINIPKLHFTDKVKTGRNYTYRLVMTGRDGIKNATNTLKFSCKSGRQDRQTLPPPLVAN
jgi:hypothetical protein